MLKRKRRTSAITYARRLTEDDYVQGQLRQAASGLGQAYERVSRRRGKAAEDKKLYGHLREAATSIRRAVLALQRKPPEPKHRGRNLALLALAGGGAAVAVSERRRSQLAAMVPTGSDDGDETGQGG
jgi:hypothetical protein